MTATRAFIAVLLVLIAGMAVALVLQNRTIEAQHQALLAKSAEPQEQLDGGVVRASTVEGAPGDALASAAAEGVPVGTVTTDAKAHGATVNSTSSTRTTTTGKRESNVPSTGTQERQPDAAAPTDAKAGDDKWGYTRARKYIDLSEPMPGAGEVPWGRVGFSAWQEKPWDVSVVPRTYKVVTVGAVTDDGRRYAYSRFTVEVDGKEYPVTIQSAKYVEDLPTGRFRWHLKPLIAVDLAASVFGGSGLQVLPGVQLAIAGYGTSPQLPEWLFVILGLAADTTGPAGALTLTPLSWNLHRALPFVDNTYVGATVSFTTQGLMGVGGGVRVGL